MSESLRSHTKTERMRELLVFLSEMLIRSFFRNELIPSPDNIPVYKTQLSQLVKIICESFDLFLDFLVISCTQIRILYVLNMKCFHLYKNKTLHQQFSVYCRRSLPVYSVL